MDHIEFVLHILVCVCVCVCGFLNNPFKIVKRKKKLLNSQAIQKRAMGWIWPIICSVGHRCDLFLQVKNQAQKAYVTVTSGIFRT